MKRLTNFLAALSLCLFAGHLTAQDSPSVSYRAAMSQAVRNAAAEVLPSVVSIEVVGVAQTGGNSQSEVAQDAPTCGIVVDDQGHVLASDIVVRRPSASLLVVLPDQTRLAAEVVSRDHHRGLVLLRVKASDALTPVQLPSAIDLPIGSTVVAVGRYGREGSPIVSSGILSAMGRLEGTMIQCDARVSPAFYGGILVDLQGTPLGILVPAVAKGGAPDETSWYDSGIAFAVPGDVIATKLPRLTAGEDIRKGLIGIVPRSKDPYAEDTELAAVRNRSPAETAGLAPGDSVLKVAGKPVRMFEEIRQALGPFDAGEEIELEVGRDGKTRTVSVTLAESIPPLQPQRLGLWVVEQQSEEADAPPDLLVRGVVPGSQAQTVFEVGDVIQSVGETKVKDLASLRRLLITAVPDEKLGITVRRGDADETLEITPTPIAGPVLKDTIADWDAAEVENKWDVAELRLPDVANKAAFVGPKPDEADAADALGMVVLILPPEKREPTEVLESWRDVATRYGVMVVAVASADEKRWQSQEVDVVARITRMAQQRVPVEESAVALASAGAVDGVDASAADSMVVAIALSDRQIFTGIAVSENARPPAVRLRENEPDSSIQILLPIESIDDGPTWLAPVASAGFPIALGGKNTLNDLLRWVRLLQTI